MVARAVVMEPAVEKAGVKVAAEVVAAVAVMEPVVVAVMEPVVVDWPVVAV